jgi:hypothetical protein
MRKLDFHKLFRARTPAAQQALEGFVAAYQYYANINDFIALNILVWGPGLNLNERIARKRIDIHGALLQQGHNALFSEELVEEAEDLSLKSLELAQALAADLIIVLLSDSAIGAVAEVADFGNHPDIAWKVFVLAPVTFKARYPGLGTLFLLEKGYGGVYWYHDAEVESCQVRSEALIRAQARREIYANFRRVNESSPQ